MQWVKWDFVTAEKTFVVAQTIEKLFLGESTTALYMGANVSEIYFASC